MTVGVIARWALILFPRFSGCAWCFWSEVRLASVERLAVVGTGVGRGPQWVVFSVHSRRGVGPFPTMPVYLVTDRGTRTKR